MEETKLIQDISKILENDQNQETIAISLVIIAIVLIIVDISFSIKKRRK